MSFIFEIIGDILISLLRFVVEIPVIWIGEIVLFLMTLGKHRSIQEKQYLVYVFSSNFIQLRNDYQDLMIFWESYTFVETIAKSVSGTPNKPASLPKDVACLVGLSWMNW